MTGTQQRSNKRSVAGSAAERPYPSEERCTPAGLAEVSLLERTEHVIIGIDRRGRGIAAQQLLQCLKTLITLQMRQDSELIGLEEVVVTDRNEVAIEHMENELLERSTVRQIASFGCHSRKACGTVRLVPRVERQLVMPVFGVFKKEKRFAVTQCFETERRVADDTQSAASISVCG